MSMDAGKIIDWYVAGEIDAPTAAEKLTGPVAQAFVLGREDEAEYWLWEMWERMMEVVRNHSDMDPATQDSLISLLRAIKETGMPSSSSPPQIWGREFDWGDLPVLGAAVREDWNCPPVLVQDNSSRTNYSKEQWTSMNGFVARMSVTDVFDFWVYGIWAMRDCFEEPLRAEELDLCLPSAAVWILVAGNLMYDLVKAAQPPQDIANASNGGTLWRGSVWYNLERWLFWKQGFHSAMGRSDLDSLTRAMAERAHSMMDHIEGVG